MIIKRGEVYKFRVSRKETEGTEQQKNRPAVIISTNRLNKKNYRFVAIPITSKKLARIYDFEVPVVVGGKNGKALCDQVRIYNETRLIKKEGRLGNFKWKRNERNWRKSFIAFRFWGINWLVLRNLWLKKLKK